MFFSYLYFSVRISNYLHDHIEMTLDPCMIMASSVSQLYLYSVFQLQIQSYVLWWHLVIQCTITLYIVDHLVNCLIHGVLIVTTKSQLLAVIDNILAKVSTNQRCHVNSCDSITINQICMQLPLEKQEFPFCSTGQNFLQNLLHQSVIVKKSYRKFCPILQKEM